ncbi:MAG: OmpA family protein [Hydrogenophaga sp.]|uniref:OmpA family protein n=1 Tax=Hydrogenophaga sp. TaxID=1904254 RepID=UPI001D791AA6|nr:OmpA family protein [Hydrogenophaga sp.]MBX3610350.1 OmpA family protein [Hydrogenophaga sp.]
MATQDNEPEQRVVAVVLIALIVLIIGGVLGLGVFSARGGKAPKADGKPAMAAPAATTAPAPASASDASVVVDNGVVKFYFATGKADLAAGALGALAEAIEAAKGGARLVISGFHDATGDPAFNAELAKQRAFAVRDALVGAGVAETSLELKKPEVTTGSGADAEARRVEVVIAR